MKRLQNEKGITLTELLAVFVIGAIVLGLVLSVQMFVQRQFKTQSEDAKHLTDVTIAAKSITRDVRMAEEDEIDVIKNRALDFTERHIKYVWDEERNVLMKNNSDYIFDVENFEVSLNDEDIFSLTIKSTTGKKVETEIMIR